MEIARLRAELARVKMERDILGKATAYFAKERSEVRLHPTPPPCMADLGALPSAGGQRERVSRALRRREIGDTSRPRRHQRRCAAGAHPGHPRRDQRRATAGRASGRNCWRAAFAWARSGCKSSCSCTASRQGPSASFKVTTDSNHGLPVAPKPAEPRVHRRPSPISVWAATSPTSPPTRAGCSWPW